VTPYDPPEDFPDAAVEPDAENVASPSATPLPVAEAEANSFLVGADAVRAFVAREWKRRLDYRLKKEVWSYGGNLVSILFEYEWHDAEADQWMLTHGEEVWEIAADGLLRRVKATGQDIAIAEIDRWVLPRPITGPTPVD
jgi:nuclear transport factor 2 (NTF2) superfamily protein